MKNKKTSHPKTKPVKANVPKEEPNLIERAMGEKDMPLTAYSRADGKKYTRELFSLWCTLPDTFKGAPERITALLGITDEVTLKVLEISTMQQFASTFGVIPQTLSRWRREIETSSDYMDDVKRQMKPLTKNVMAALYRKLIEEGDGPRFTAWMKVVEGWREQLGIEHSGSVSDGLSDEEKKALDDLIKKNTA